MAADSNQQRGEIVLVVAGAEVQTDASLLQAQQLYRALLDELPPSRAAKVAAKIHGVPRRALYGADD